MQTVRVNRPEQDVEQLPDADISYGDVMASQQLFSASHRFWAKQIATLFAVEIDEWRNERRDHEANELYKCEPIPDLTYLSGGGSPSADYVSGCL